MGLKLIFGRAGSGKSKYCYNEIKKNIENKEKIYLITPEQFSFTAETKLMEEIDTKAIMQAEVIHLSRLAKRVIQELGIKTKTISKCGKAMLINYILTMNKNNLTYLSKSEQNIDIAISSITELKKHGVNIETLKKQIETTENKYLKTKLQDISIIYEQYDKQIQENYIDEADELSILAQNINKINWIKESVIYIDEFAGFTYPEFQVIKELIKYAKQVNITITTDDLQNNQKPDTDIFYPNKLTIEKLLNLVNKNNLELEKPIEIDGQNRFKTLELKKVEKELFSNKSTRYEQNVENINIFLAKNQYTEIENVAKEITKLVREKNFRYKEIAIITKNIQKYANLAKVIFSKYDIPIFIDEKRELSQNVIIQYILSVLDVILKDYSRESLFQYIKMGFTKISDEDIFKLENYCIKWGIKQYKFKSDFIYELETKKEEVEYLNKLRKQIIEPIENLKQKIRKQKTAKGIGLELYEFIKTQEIDIQIENKIEKLKNERPDLAQEYKESYEILINILDEINTIFGETKISVEIYKNLLKQGIESSGLGKIPGTQDQVIMGDVDRSRTHKVKAIFIIGLNDGIYPSINKNEGFLGDDDRNYLKEKGIELAKGTLENLYDDKFNIYKAFTTAENMIFLSYSSADTDGSALRPSIYISKIRKMFPKLIEESDIISKKYDITNQKATYENLIEILAKQKKLEDIWKETYMYFKTQNEWKQELEKDISGINFTNIPQPIQKETIEKLYGNTLKTSVSKLEKYKSCAFSYFLQYGLNLKEKEELKIQSFDTGSFMHEVIDMFFDEIKDRGIKLTEFIEEDEKVTQIVHQIIKSKLDYTKYKFAVTVKCKTLIKRLEKMISKALKYIIESLVYSEFKVKDTEAEFGNGRKYNPIILNLENNKKVEITGKIDRIDIAESEDGKYLRIIDYKSSVKNIDLNEVYAGIQIQLLTYMDAICKQEDLMPAGVLYFSLIEQMIKSDKKITEEEIEEEIRKNFKMKGLILADVKIIKMHDKNLESGTSKLVPATITKSGEISKSKTNGVNKEEFSILQKYIDKIIKQISKEIYSGNIDIKPYNKNGKKPCEYCAYKSICGFNPKLKGNKYNYIEKKSKDDIILMMKKQI